MKSDIASAKVRDGPTKNLRPRLENKNPDYKIGLLFDDINTAKKFPSSCTVSLNDGKETFETIGRCDDGSDDTLVSPAVAESAAVMVIMKLTSITPVNPKFSLQKGEDCQSFKFSRSCTVPLTVMKMASVHIALDNVTYLVAEDKLGIEDLLIGLPVVQHLHVDSRTLIGNNRALLDVTDGFQVVNRTESDRGGQINLITVARLTRIPNSQVLKSPIKYEESRPKINFYAA